MRPMWLQRCIYIVVKQTITVTDPDNNAYEKKLAFKNRGLR